MQFQVSDINQIVEKREKKKEDNRNDMGPNPSFGGGRRGVNFLPHHAESPRCRPHIQGIYIHNLSAISSKFGHLVELERRPLKDETRHKQYKLRKSVEFSSIFIAESPRIKGNRLPPERDK